MMISHDVSKINDVKIKITDFYLLKKIKKLYNFIKKK
jgi:hypothetical protein